MGTEFGRLTGHPSAALLVPMEARSAWAGSDFTPGTVADPPVTTIAEGAPSQGLESSDSPLWLMILGAAAVGGVLWLLVRRPSEEEPA